MNKLWIFTFFLMMKFIVSGINASEIEQLKLEQLCGEKGKFENIQAEGSNFIIKFHNKPNAIYFCSIDDGKEFKNNIGQEFYIPLGLNIRFRYPGCSIRFMPLPKPLTPFGYHVVYAYGGGHPPRRGYHYEGYLLIIDKSDSNKDLTVTSPTDEAAMAALKEAGIDPASLPPSKEPPFEIPDEARPLKFEDLFGEKGIFEGVKSDLKNFYFKFKSAGEQYEYSVNYLKPVASKSGEEITIPTGGKFRMTGKNVKLEIYPLPQPIDFNSIGVVVETDQRATGKGLIRIEGFLVASGDLKSQEDKTMKIIVTYPSIAADLIIPREHCKWEVMKYESLIGEHAEFKTRNGHAYIENVDRDSTSFTIKVNAQKYPFEYGIENDRKMYSLQKPDDLISVPIGTVVELGGANNMLWPLPEPLRNSGLHAMLLANNGRLLKEGYLLFTGREQDGKKEMIVTEPYVGAALIALEKARKGPVTIVAAEEKKAKEYDGPPVLVPPGCKPKYGTVPEPYTKTGWAKEVVSVKTGIELVFVPAGEFLMGSPVAEVRDDTAMPHKVKLTKPYYMGKYEVTQGQWESVLSDNPSEFFYVDEGEEKANLPVDHASWNEAQAFLKKLCETEGVPAGTFRLPTEAEWERACRAGTTTALYTGPLTVKGEMNGPELDPIAWYGGNSGVKSGGNSTSDWKEKQYDHKQAGTHPVGKKAPNAYGIHDMLGNVCEWCSDYYEPYDGKDALDPVGPASGDSHVNRGGGWCDKAMRCRLAFRSYAKPDLKTQFFGLRIAVSAVQKQ